MNRLSEPERLVALETKMDTVIEQQKAISDKLDKVLPTFVTESDHSKAISVLHKRINDLNKRSWVQNTLSALAGSVVTFLLMYFLTNIGKG